jgi:hypothetical protein
MNDHRTFVVDAEQSLAAFAAELTAAAYSVAFRHTVGDKWLDLELELWRAPSHRNGQEVGRGLPAAG